MATGRAFRGSGYRLHSFGTPLSGPPLQSLTQKHNQKEYLNMKRVFAFLISVFLLASTACAYGSSGIKSSDNGELSDMKISIQITSDSGSHSLAATLAENSSAMAFYELLHFPSRKHCAQNAAPPDGQSKEYLPQKIKWQSWQK